MAETRRDMSVARVHIMTSDSLWDMQQRQMEYTHHGDALVPRQQRFGQYTRSIMTALGVPVMNQFGLRPAVVKGSTEDYAT